MINPQEKKMIQIVSNFDKFLLLNCFQVFLRIKDTEWNVYRRYSQFNSLHRDLKKRDPVISSFSFPPKKHIGNKVSHILFLEITQNILENRNLFGDESIFFAFRIPSL